MASLLPAPCTTTLLAMEGGVGGGQSGEEGREERDVGGERDGGRREGRGRRGW